MNLNRLEGIEKNEIIIQLSTIIEYMETVFNIRNTSQLLNETANFIVQTLKISNCSITIKDQRTQYYSNPSLKQIYAEIEAKLIKDIQNLKTNIKIKNAKEDYLTKNVQNSSLIPKYIIAMPLINEKEFLGMTALYSEKEIRNISMAEEISKKMIEIFEKIIDYNKIQTSAITDPLTGLYNRSFMTSHLKKSIEELEKEHKSITIAMIDVDNFKNFNDTKGHLEGDRMLIEITQKIKKTLKEEESACRYGGEEFLIIMPNMAQQESFEKLENLRKQIEKECELTISTGTITSHKSDLSYSLMLKNADDALYEAKRKGKNTIVSYVSVDKNLGIINVATAETFGKTS